MRQELRRLRQTVGKEGRISRRLSAAGSDGGWADSIHSVNDLVEDMVRPTRETARVITAVANGDLSQTIPLEVDGQTLQGQFARAAKTVNTMVSQLSSFTSEVTRVAREVGTEGKLGGQAHVKGGGGVWKGHFGHELGPAMHIVGVEWRSDHLLRIGAPRPDPR